jgi:predicted amidohydrolase YtcJ
VTAPLVQADIVLTGGRVWCGLAEGSAEAVALWGGRVLATGTAAEIGALVGPATRVVDLKDRMAVPGLNDAHMHLLPYGLAMTEVDLRPKAAPTLAALLAALAERAKVTPPGAWVIGRGYDHFLLDTGRHPFREELDAACPDNPVLITRTDGHISVANSRALALAGIDETTPQPEGGHIEHQNGRLTGLLAENARFPVQAAIPKPSVEKLVDAIERGGRDLLSYGITSCMDAAVGMVCGWPEMQAYQQAHRTGRLPVRVYACIMGDKTRTILPQAMEAGLVTGGGDAMLRIGPVKFFTDGSFGGRTAAMSVPYTGGGPDDLGILCLTDAEVMRMAHDIHAAGYSMAIHAIGDRAIEQILVAMEAALDAMPDDPSGMGRRHRIEHCGWLTPGQMDRMAARHILPGPQPAFHYYFGDLYLTLTDRARAEASYPMRTWMQKGLHPSASTDCPVCEIAPMPNLYTMVTRRTHRGTVMGEAERLTLAEALHACTWAGAYGSREEAIKGRLAPGQLADVAVLSRDLFDGPPEAILDTVCDMTILDGRVVWERAAA